MNQEKFIMIEKKIKKIEELLEKTLSKSHEFLKSTYDVKIKKPSTQEDWEKKLYYHIYNNLNNDFDKLNDKIDKFISNFNSKGEGTITREEANKVIIAALWFLL